jgi:hypothetical protein
MELSRNTGSNPLRHLGAIQIPDNRRHAAFRKAHKQRRLRYGTGRLVLKRVEAVLSSTLFRSHYGVQLILVMPRVGGTFQQ